MNKHKSQWEDQLLEQFMAIVKAPYGDFAAIERLVKATSDAEGLQQVVASLSQHTQAQYAFQERFVLGDIDLLQLHRLPAHTFGYAYAEHMLSNKFKPIQMQVSENDYTYLMLHLTETHDIWHVLTGSDTSMTGEIQLHTFTAAQLRFSRFSLAMLAKNILKTAIDAIEEAEQRMDALAQGWLMGRQASPLFGIQWNTLWEVPLKQLQTQLNISPGTDRSVLAMEPGYVTKLH